MSDSTTPQKMLYATAAGSKPDGDTTNQPVVNPEPPAPSNKDIPTKGEPSACAESNDEEHHDEKSTNEHPEECITIDQARAEDDVYFNEDFLDDEDQLERLEGKILKQFGADHENRRKRYRKYCFQCKPAFCHARPRQLQRDDKEVASSSLI